MRKTFKYKKVLTRIGIGLSLLLVMMNIVAAIHAWHFTHFDTSEKKTAAPGSLGCSEKISVLFSGIHHPKPQNTMKPEVDFQEIVLKQKCYTNCWYSRHSGGHALGTVILFHGYLGKKSDMLDRAAVFDSLGYHTLLVDFMGCGDSDGTRTTIGWYEADQVKAAYDFIAAKKETNIILFGSSMGAASVMRALAVHHIHPQKIVIECPFGSIVSFPKLSTIND